MVGVARSTGCLACRKSKVKCDEVKPLCRRCSKSGRTCEYADRFRFVHETDKQTAKDNSSDQRVVRILTPPKPGVFSYTTEKRTKNGSLFQKWHKAVRVESPIHSIPMSPTEIQAYDLIRCWSEGPLGMRFDLIALWFRGLPARLGKSSALDDAVHIVSSMHGRMVVNPDPSQWMCPASYAKALRSLREALLDPEQGYWVETITAALILYHIEERFGCPFVYNNLHHAGGVGRLLQVRGPVGGLRDSFEWEIISQIQGPIISHSISLGTPCFLSEQHWADYFDSFEPRTEHAALMQELAVQIVQWPSLTLSVRKLRSGSLSATELHHVRNRIQKIRSRLDALEIVIDEHLTDPEVANLVPTQRLDSPFDMVYEFSGSHVIPLINLHSSYIFVLDRMLDFINSLTPIPNSNPPLGPERLRLSQYQRLLEKICRTFEYTALRRPMLSGACVLSLATAFSYVQTEELRSWFLMALNETDEHRLIAQLRYTPQTIGFVNELYIGAVDNLFVQKLKQNKSYKFESPVPSSEED